MSYFISFFDKHLLSVGCRLILRNLKSIKQKREYIVTKKRQEYHMLGKYSFNQLVSIHLANDWFKLIAICTLLHWIYFPIFGCDTFFSRLSFPLPTFIFCVRPKSIFPVVTKLKCSNRLNLSILRTSANNESNFVNNSIFGCHCHCHHRQFIIAKFPLCPCRFVTFDKRFPIFECHCSFVPYWYT